MTRFSHVVKIPTIRCIITLTTHKKWPIYQLDVNNAFLHGDLHKEVYMKVTVGFPNPHNYVCRLKKSLYVLSKILGNCLPSLSLNSLSKASSSLKMTIASLLRILRFILL